jgi:hypothetical protein
MLRFGLIPLLFSIAVTPAVQAQITNVPRPAPVLRGEDTVKTGEPLGGRQERAGLWLGGGAGYGTVGCCGRAGSIGGVTGSLEVGWTLSRRFLVGIGTSLWNRSGLGETERLGMTVGSVDLRLRWYPSEMAGGLFLTGALGLGLIRLSDQQAIPSSYTQTGRAFRAGLGYDFRVAPGLSITPFGSRAAIRTQRDGDSMQADVWQLGIGFTVH